LNTLNIVFFDSYLQKPFALHTFFGILAPDE
jgi:hypothetical protein